MPHVGHLVVHHIPEGDWFCETCKSKQENCVGTYLRAFLIEMYSVW